MTRVYIYPELGEDIGGIARVLEAQHRHLPDHGIEIVGRPEEAEVLASHVTMPPPWRKLYPGVPLVAHVHGLYWTPEFSWPPWAMAANDDVMRLIRCADVTTAPSEWVAQALRRGSLRDVRVIRHGIDADDWRGRESDGYVLWNKTRPDPVCDPRPLLELVERMPDVEFMSTFSSPSLSQNVADHEARANLRLTGTLPFAEARRLVERAGVYLATVRETYGIGTLEAMAAGVPVVAWYWGGQAEFLRGEDDGAILVDAGDVGGLEVGIRYALANRERLGAAARVRARALSWDAPAAQYADLYHRLAIRAQSPTPTVSIIVTAYNLEQYLPDCLASVAEQSGNWECIVVDDCSPDRCGEIAQEWAERDPRFVPLRTPRNLYLAGARNFAIAQSLGRYILPLDADDMIAPGTVARLSEALDEDRERHIAYGGVLFVDADGRTPTNYGGPSPGHSGWPVEFDLRWQLTGGANLLPYSSMYRRAVWERTGGYRTRWRTGEDADFWTRATSYGFRAEKVTGADTLIYRNRPESMSRAEGQRRDWPAWYPWMRDRSLLPAAADAPDTTPWRPSWDPPLISVVIPVGPGHGEFVLDAVDSVDAQTFRAWECLVVNDSGAPLPALPPWVRVIELPGRERFDGAAAARNAGVRASIARHFLPLDADDVLMPGALRAMWDAAVEAGGDVIVYSDFWDDGPMEGEDVGWHVYRTADYEPRRLISHGAQWIVSALTPRAAFEEVGGYDESLPVWEDWGFAIATAAAGWCARRVAAPLVSYRKHTGRRRAQNMEALSDGSGETAMRERWGRFWEGEELMACRKCGAGPRTTVQAQASGSGGGDGAAASLAAASFGSEPVLLSYDPGTGAQARRKLRGKPSGRIYFWAPGEQKYVDPVDVPHFLKIVGFSLARPSETAEVAGPDGGPMLNPEGPPTREPETAAFVARKLVEVPPRAELERMRRADLEILAADELGIEGARELPNKTALIDAILGLVAEGVPA